MSQNDLFGKAPGDEKQFKDIRNTRQSSAEEKASLAFQLRELCRQPPPNVVSGSIQLTRQWMASQKTALKVLGNARSSVGQLSSEVANMRRYKA